jgi:hypothetical protein
LPAATASKWEFGKNWGEIGEENLVGNFEKEKRREGIYE